MELETIDLPVAGLSAEILCGLLSEERLDPQGAFNEAGIRQDVATHAAGEVTGRQLLALQHAFATRTARRPDLWAETGRRHRLMSNGILDSALMTAPSFGDALRIGQSLGPLHHSLAAYIARDQSDRFALRLDLAKVPAAIKDFITLWCIEGLNTHLEGLLGSDLPATRLDIALSASYAQYLKPPPGMTLHFGSQDTIWSWDASMIATPLRHSAPLLHDAFLSRCLETMRPARLHKDIIDRISAALQQSGGSISLRELATGWGMTERTVQRELQKRGLSFRGLVRQFRVKQACDMLHMTRLPIDQIAFDLGYEDAASFRTSFKEWTGLTPSTFRAAAVPYSSGEFGQITAIARAA